MRKIFKIITLISLLIFLGAQEGCQTTSGTTKVTKQSVKQEMIIDLQGKIEELEGTPLTEEDIKAKKYKGILNKKDKHIKALQEQLAELKAKKEKEKADAAYKETIAHIAKKIEGLGGKALTKDEIKYEGEFSDDEYVKALQQQLKELKDKKEKDEAIAHIAKKIEDLGGKALTKDEIKYEGEFSDDEYVKALQQQLKELKEQIKKDKEDAEKKAAKEKEAKERAAAIDDVKKEILFLGETPFPEYEFSTEDKYIAALRQQIEEIKKQKEEEELKINAEIPGWYSNMPKGSETIMYSRGTHISVDLDQSETIAIENAVVKLALNLQRRTDAKLDIIAREAGVDGDLTLKQEFKTISKSVAKQASITGYKVYNTKMAPIANGKFRTFIVIEFPISLAYKAYLANIENNPAIKDKLSKLKDTEAYKELEKSVEEFTGA